MKQGAVSRQHKPSADSERKEAVVYHSSSWSLPNVQAAERGLQATHLSSVAQGDAGKGRLAGERCTPSRSGGWKYGSA